MLLEMTVLSHRQGNGGSESRPSSEQRSSLQNETQVRSWVCGIQFPTVLFRFILFFKRVAGSYHVLHPIATCSCHCAFRMLWVSGRTLNLGQPPGDLSRVEPAGSELYRPLPGEAQYCGSVPSPFPLPPAPDRLKPTRVATPPRT